MRLFTIKHHENECVAVKTKAGRLCTLKSLGFGELVNTVGKAT